MSISLANFRKPGRPASDVTTQEELILKVLNLCSTHGTEIARQAGIPTGGIYTLLRRLEKKQLVERIETTINFGGTQLKRVIYKLKPKDK